MKTLVGICLLTLLYLPVPAVASTGADWELGLRGGMDATGADQSYGVGELYLLRPFSWRARLADGVLMPRIDLGAGYLEAADDRGGWLAAGVDLVYAVLDGNLELEAGFRPTLLFDDDYGNDNYGGPLQFASHVGIALRVSPLVIGYRYQHLSNGGLYKENDGLNLHLFGVGVRF